jgi:hypothetical protein
MTNDPRLKPFQVESFEFAAVGEWAYLPVVPTAFHGIASDEPMEVVGESRYHDGIHRVVSAWREGGSEEGQLIAFWFAEPGNPFDKNAVRVLLAFENIHATCGYLPKEQAYRFSQAVRNAADLGQIPALHARAFGGTSDKPNYGIWMGLPKGAYGEDGELSA